MNKQENVYNYYLQMAEFYAEKHKISREEAFNLFTKYLVYENILSQSEFWGHYNLEENLSYIENTLLTDEKRQCLVFHGSTYDFDQIDISKSQGYRDFGNGFYTTVIYNQAKAWAKRNEMRSFKKKACVYTFLFNSWKADDLKVKEFLNCSDEWLEFVLMNRKSEILAHNFDIVIGPVADDDISETLQALEAGKISKNGALERLSYKKTSNQISFHTKEALDCLVLTEKEIK